MSEPSNPLAGDLDEILEVTRDLWSDLTGARILITGGTGFYGSWLLESFAWANDRLSLGSDAIVLTRDPGAFEAKAPHLAGHPSIRLMAGDVRRPPAFGHLDAAIHGASASAQLSRDDPLGMLDTLVEGARRILDAVSSAGTIPVLLTSSGAVYGRQPPGLDHLPEDWSGGPDPLDSAFAYAEGKRLTEMLGAAFAATTDLQVKVARGFAFVGPYLPLDRHFAIGNFIRDGMADGPIRVGGDGTTVRSYLYAADLAAWLWTILLRGETGRAYNVGSEHAIDIASLAHAVAAAFDPVPAVEILRSSEPGRPADRYVPSTERARRELGVAERVPITEAIARTVAWHRGR